ncbi:MAG: DUF1552 domain-containing protein, partial [Pseudomonadales bacterium]|nr:DUF1552 domain-containing protein [Pseudomonadales bacterium]
PGKPTGIPDTVEAHLRLMYDLIVLAWQADITRVTTFLTCNELSPVVYPGSGVRDGFHTLSHHSNNEENKARFALINRYHINLLNDFVSKLDALHEAYGSVLDHSLVM